MEKDMDLIEALTQSVENKVNPEEIIKQLEKVLNECEKGKDKSQHKKIHLVLKKFSDDIFNHNVADLLKVQMKFCDRNIYRLFLEVENYELFLQQANEYFDSKNKISLFIIIKILTICSPKEIILFLNEHLNDINLIEKKFFIIEVYNRILDKIEKKELFLDQIFPLILISFSSAIQKFIKNKEKLNSNPEFITNKDIIINFEKYVINLIRNMMHLCKNFKEMQDPSIKNKLLTISDIVDIDQTTGKLNTKHLNPNLLLKHYLISFVMDIMEGVLDALSTPFFDRNILNTFLQELILYLFELNDNKFDFITCFLTQVRYFTIMNAKPSTIKENIRSYDKFYPYNCLAIANILSTLIKDETFNIFTMKYQLKLIMPVVYENFKSDDSKIQLYFPLIKQLGQLLNNEKGINQFNLFNFENLNIFNVPLADFVKYLLELSGNFNCEEDNRKVMVEMSNVLIEMPHEIAKYNLISEIISNSNNSNLVAYIMSLLKKKIQVLLDQKCNDPIQNPIINKLNLRNLIEICLNKNKFSGISSKIELVNEIINFMIYIQLKFKNFSNIAAEYVPTENHLMNSSSIEIYETITNILFSYEKEIKEELDNINTKKKEIENDSKKPNNDKQKEIEGMEIKSNQFLLLIENLKRLQASKN